MRTNHFGEGQAQVALYQLARDRWSAAVVAENTARQDRDGVLLIEVEHLVGTVNTLTNKPHSATSAETAAKQIFIVKEANRRLDEAQQAKWRAETDYTAAAMEAELHIAALRREGTVAA